MSYPRLQRAYQIPGPARQKSEAVLVPQIRKAVDAWRQSGYEGATETSTHLLRHWFESDHEVKGEPWLYYYCQREAVETTVYLYEVLRRRRLQELILEFADQDKDIRYNPFEDRWCRYVYKMATGSGKTKVMSLLIAWSYFNAVREDRNVADAYAKTFLVLAPNVIVYERLRQDFGNGGQIFRDDPVVPPEWKDLWQFDIVTRDEPAESAYREGAIFLTNIQQMYPARGPRSKEPQQLRDVIGEPAMDIDVSAGTMMRSAIEKRSDLMVLNDEGHHIHSTDLKWHETIESFNEGFVTCRGGGIKAQFDFSATPKDGSGKLFDNILVDYPIRQAITDGVTKHPHLVTLENARDLQVADAGERYKDKLVAGIAHFGELCDRMSGADAQPLMFVMTENTKSADEVTSWFVRQGHFRSNEILTIHTDRYGMVSEAASKLNELRLLRNAARDVDSPMSPYKVIVSVLMLREGWDVKNVCLIVPLRRFTSRREILPEQTLGRGLRRMFPIGAGDEREQLLVIDHEAFADFWRQEVDGELLPIDITREKDFHQTAITVMPDPDKATDFEVVIPRLSPVLAREFPDLDELRLSDLESRRFALPVEGLSEDIIHYNVREMDSWNIVDRGDIEREFSPDPVGYLNFMCDLILRECSLRGLSDGFAKLAPKVRRYIEEVGFQGQAPLNDARALIALNDANTTNAILDVFVRGINELAVTQHNVEDMRDPTYISRTRPFVTRRQTFPNPRRSVFNHVPGDSDLELDFARWLDRRANDVAAFAKNESAVGFRLEYVGYRGGIRHYYPDFVVRLTDGEMMVVETKGLETVDVARKDDRVSQWCRDVTVTSGRTWRYVKVYQDLFDGGMSWDSMTELAAASRHRMSPVTA